HGILRTVFASSADSLQNNELPESVADQFELGIVRLEVAAGQDNNLRIWMDKDHAITFDPGSFPLLRASIIASGHRHYLAITFFHQLLDGWSFSNLVLQVCSAYRALVGGLPVRLPAPHTGFADYVAHVARCQASAQAQDERAYWHQVLRPPLPLVDLPADRISCELERCAFHLETTPELATRVKAYAKSRQVTLHKVLLAAYFAVFHGLTNRRELMIGNTVAGRPADMLDADQVLGCFINILPIRIRDSSAPFDQLLDEVASTIDAALAHNRLPNEWHVAQLLPHEKASGMDWRVIFALDNFPEDFESELIHWPPYSWNAIEPFAIALSVIDLRGKLYCYWNYRSDLFNEVSVRDIAQRYLAFLETLDDKENTGNHADDAK
ncbi:MAG: condensation domain-containing protein, partial [Giesbergeria sp.]